MTQFPQIPLDEAYPELRKCRLPGWYYPPKELRGEMLKLLRDKKVFAFTFQFPDTGHMVFYTDAISGVLTLFRLLQTSHKLSLLTLVLPPEHLTYFTSPSLDDPKQATTATKNRVESYGEKALTQALTQGICPRDFRNFIVAFAHDDKKAIAVTVSEFFVKQKNNPNEAISHG